MDKEEFHWVFGVLRGWFSAKLGSKISDGSQLHNSQTSIPKFSSAPSAISPTNIIPAYAFHHVLICPDDYN
jgi:hypothetical protein